MIVILTERMIIHYKGRLLDKLKKRYNYKPSNNKLIEQNMMIIFSLTTKPTNNYFSKTNDDYQDSPIIIMMEQNIRKALRRWSSTI